MPLMTHLHKRNGTYYFRRVFPPAVRPLLPGEWWGKRELFRSLDTKDGREAKVLRIKYDQLYADLIAQATPRPKEQFLSADQIAELCSVLRYVLLRTKDKKLTEYRRSGADKDFESLAEMVVQRHQTYKWDEEIEDLYDVEYTESEEDHAKRKAEFIVSHKASWRRMIIDGELKKIADSALLNISETKESLKYGETGRLQPLAEASLRAINVDLAPNSPSWFDLREALARTLMEANGIVLKMIEGDDVPLPSPPVIKSRSAPPKDVPDLDTAFAVWKRVQKPRVQTEHEFYTAIRLFREAFGDMPLSAIRQKHASEFRDLLATSPTRLKKAERALSIRELAKLGASDEQRPRRAPATVNKYLNGMKAIVGAAIEDGLLGSDNTANPFKVKLLKVSRSNRRPFRPEELERIFTDDVYVGNLRPHAGRGEAAYWIPLIGLYTGFRLEEICQLLLTDVRQEGSIFYFDAVETDDDGYIIKTLKAGSSRRRVPVHKDLIEIGFLDYLGWQNQKRSNIGMLFDFTERDRDGRLSPNWSKFFGRWKRELGIKDPNAVFHSFRHAFKDACRFAQIGDEVAYSLLGHSSGNVSQTYGTAHPISVLKTAIDKLSFGYDPSALRWAPPGAVVRTRKKKGAG